MIGTVTVTIGRCDTDPMNSGENTGLPVLKTESRSGRTVRGSNGDPGGLLELKI